MHLEIKSHTHLKGLNSGLEPSTRPGHGSNLVGPLLSSTLLILLNREANVRFVLLFAVDNFQLQLMNSLEKRVH